jgi:hypothetical protein
VVGFRGAYHAILGRPCYAKFMAVPNYTYLKMKMPGPNGVITVGSSIEHAFDRDIECVEHAEALALDEALVTTLEKMVNEDLDSTTKHVGNFEAAEQTKEVPLDPAAPEAEAEGGGLRGARHPQCFASSTIIYFMMYVFNSYLASNLAQTIMFEA